MRWRLIIEEFGPNIQHISRVENKLSNTLGRFMSTTVDQDKPITTRYISRSNELF